MTENADTGSSDQFKELRKERWVQAYQVFTVELFKQTDRGIAIMSAAFLEDELANAIKSWLHISDEETDQLFTPSGPLGSFDAKSRLIYGMGLVGHDIFKDLDYIRKVRNKFAHWALAPNSKGEFEPVTFETQDIAAWCKNLRYPDVYPQIDSKARYERMAKRPETLDDASLKKEPLKTFPAFSDPKKRFWQTVAALQWVIYVAGKSKDHPDPKNEIPFDYRNPLLGVTPGFAGFAEDEGDNPLTDG
jgi:hypothetical protein